MGCCLCGTCKQEPSWCTENVYCPRCVHFVFFNFTHSFTHPHTLSHTLTHILTHLHTPSHTPKRLIPQPLDATALPFTQMVDPSLLPLVLPMMWCCMNGCLGRSRVCWRGGMMLRWTWWCFHPMVCCFVCGERGWWGAWLLVVCGLYVLCWVMCSGLQEAR